MSTETVGIPRLLLKHLLPLLLLLLLHLLLLLLLLKKLLGLTCLC